VIFFRLFIFLICMSLFFSACGKKQKYTISEDQNRKTAPLVMPEKKAEEIYRYGGEAYRDPFIPLTEKRVISPLLQSSGEGEKPNLSSLSLKGIVIDKNFRMALLSGPFGSYILKNGKLFDNRNRVIKGFSGNVETKTVIITSDDNFSKTYKISESE